MPVPEDVVVQRVEGAAVSEANLTGLTKVGVIGRSLGKATSASGSITRGAGDTDAFPTDYDEARSCQRAVYGSGSILDTFYPGIHFLIKEGDTIITPTNFGDSSDPSALVLDWSSAPPLVAPSITSAVVTAGAGAGAPGDYYYAITAIDHNSVETSLGPVRKVTVTGLNSEAVLGWPPVDYSAGYKVYRGVAADNLGFIASIASKQTVSYADPFGDVPGAAAPAANSTQAKPLTGEDYLLYYYYSLYTYNTPTVYTSYAQVVEDHGTGSELANVARVCMSADENNAPVLVACVPETTAWAAYQYALQRMEAADCQVVGALYVGANYATVRNAIYAHCESMSDELSGQKERYAAFGYPYSVGVSLYDAINMAVALQAKATRGKRGFIVVPDGLEARVATWYNPDGSTTEDKQVLDPTGKDITSTVFALAAMSRYAGLRDVAEPLTEKDVSGFTFPGRKFTPAEIKMGRDAGLMMVENIVGTAVVSRFVNTSILPLSLEDGEGNICFPEDWIRNDLRRRLRKYRGMKMLGAVMRAAKRTVISALEFYVISSIIAAFDEGTVSVTQDVTVRDRLKGYFKYMPIYPINQIRAFYDFYFVAL